MNLLFLCYKPIHIQSGPLIQAGVVGVARYGIWRHPGCFQSCKPDGVEESEIVAEIGQIYKHRGQCPDPKQSAIVDSKLGYCQSERQR